MASFHLSVEIVGRSEGRSAVAAAAYRAGAVLTDPDTGRVHDYGRKRGVASSWIETPDDAPDWCRDRAALWAAVHAKEKRKNSRLAREVRIALPHELTDEQRAELVREWVRDAITSRGVVADVAIHRPGRAGDDRNHHAHILVTCRRPDAGQPDGWDRHAARDLNDVSWIEALRSSWEQAQNLALLEAGSSARVDHRSLAAQREDALEAGDLDLAASLDRPAEPRLGLAAGAMEARGVPTERGDALSDARDERSRLTRALAAARAAASEIAQVLAEIAAIRPGRKPPAPPVQAATDSPDAPPDDPPGDPPESGTSPDEEPADDSGPSGP